MIVIQVKMGITDRQSLSLYHVLSAHSDGKTLNRHVNNFIHADGYSINRILVKQVLLRTIAQLLGSVEYVLW